MLFAIELLINLIGSGQAMGAVVGEIMTDPVEPFISNSNSLAEAASTPDSDRAEKGAARCPQHRPGTVLNPISFDTLTEKAEELWIELEGQLYRLRKTKQGKLILTK
ncbi:hemin uptake protein HemP [Pirellulaceae bacterium SH501]